MLRCRFFDCFRKPGNLLGRLVDEDVPGFWEASQFEYVLCFGGRENGLALLSRYLRDHDLEARFAELLPEFRTERWLRQSLRQVQEGMQLGGHPERAGRLAQIAVAHQLDIGRWC
ncbi:MAG: hypothetical protein JWN34_4087 [Bryobacterales bacterium]|jgi:hypothetical protein|nr:hypothetical protein [Bryobacterales bacterium]